MAASFASVAQALRERGHDPQAVAHFVNRLVFCMFADDVGLLPDHMFTRMLRHALPAPARFGELAGELFRAMASGGRVGFETVDWFNGSLFNDDTTLPLEKRDLKTVLAASDLDWSEIDPLILGTLFERGLDPDKRAQLGAHYTDRDKIMLLVEPVVVRPLLAEWNAEKTEITADLERAEGAKSRPARTKRLNEAERRYRAFLNRLRGFTVLDPACGSGNFLYLALQALKDLEHRVQLEAEALGFQRAFPEIGPANVKGIEINPYAAELARVSVWIGEIQWMRRNGFGEARDPILKPLDTIECRNAILTPNNLESEWPAADVVIGNPPFLGNKRMIRQLGEQSRGLSLHGGLRRSEIGQVRAADVAPAAFGPCLGGTPPRDGRFPPRIHWVVCAQPGKGTSPVAQRNSPVARQSSPSPSGSGAGNSRHPPAPVRGSTADRSATVSPGRSDHAPSTSGPVRYPDPAACVSKGILERIRAERGAPCWTSELGAPWQKPRCIRPAMHPA